MIIFSAAVLGILIGMIRRGRISAIAKIHKWPLGLLGAAILIVLHYLPYFGEIPFQSALPILSFAGYLCLLVMMLFNLDDLFAIMLAVGLTGNFVVTFINGGYMPVQELIVASMPENNPVTQAIVLGTSPCYMILQQPGTLLWFLGDILPLSFLGKFTVYFGSVPGISAGTIFVAIGLIGWLQSLMVRAKEGNKIDLNQLDHKDELKKQSRFRKKTPESYEIEEEEPLSAIDAFFKEDHPEETRYLPNLEPETLETVREDATEEAIPAETKDIVDELEETKQFDIIDNVPDYLLDEYDRTGEGDDQESDGFFSQRFKTNKSLPQTEPVFMQDDAYYQEDTGEYEPIQTAPIDVEALEAFAQDEDRLTGEKSKADEENVERSASPFNWEIDELEEMPHSKATDGEVLDASADTKTSIEEEESIETVEFDAPKGLYEDVAYVPNIPRKRYDIEDSSGYLVSKAYQEEMAKRDKTVEEMSNIWAQVAEDQKNLKSSRRRQSRYSTAEANPYLDERRRREAAELAKKEAEEQERIRRQEQELSEQRRHIQRTAEVVKQNMPSKEEDIIMTDEDRIAAGYEKVSFTIGDREVSFWKKKND